MLTADTVRNKRKCIIEIHICFRSRSLCFVCCINICLYVLFVRFLLGAIQLDCLLELFGSCRIVFLPAEIHTILNILIIVIQLDPLHPGMSDSRHDTGSNRKHRCCNEYAKLLLVLLPVAVIEFVVMLQRIHQLGTVLITVVRVCLCTFEDNLLKSG